MSLILLFLTMLILVAVLSITLRKNEQKRTRESAELHNPLPPLEPQPEIKRDPVGIADDVTPGFGAISIAISVESDAKADAIERVIEKSFRYSTLLDVFCKPQAVETAITINAPIAA